MKRNIRWVSLLIILEVFLTLTFNWNSTFPISAINKQLLIFLIPTLIIWLTFLFFFTLTFHGNNLSQSILTAVFEKNKIPLIIYSTINLFLFVYSIYFFIIADLLAPEIQATLIPFAVLGYVLFWEILILFAYTREEFKGKQKYWVGLPFLLAANYFLRHTLEHAGIYLEPYFSKVYSEQARYVFANYRWWQLLLPIKEFNGYWCFGYILIHFMENIIGIAGVWYFNQFLLMLTAFFLSWKVFRSDILSYVLAICLGFSTHIYHVFQYSCIASLYLLQILSILLLYFAYEFFRSEKQRNGYLFAIIPTLLLKAIFYEGWLDFFASIWLMFIFLFFYFKKKRQTQYRKRLLIIFIIFNIIAGIYIYLKFTYTEFMLDVGEAAIVFTYGREHIWLAVEDLISNYITHLYITLTNFLPPAFITSNALYEYTEFLYQQKSLVLGHHIFFWRFTAGVLSALFFVFFFKLVKRVFNEKPFSLDFPLVLFMIMVAVNSPTHTIVITHAFKTMPVSGYYVQQGVLGLSLCIAYLFYIFKQRTKNKRFFFFVLFLIVLIILYSSLRRPNYLWHMIEIVGLDHQGPYPNPLAVLINSIRKIFPEFLIHK